MQDDDFVHFFSLMSIYGNFLCRASRGNSHVSVKSPGRRDFFLDSPHYGGGIHSGKMGGGNRGSQGDFFWFPPPYLSDPGGNLAKVLPPRRGELASMSTKHWKRCHTRLKRLYQTDPCFGTRKQSQMSWIRCWLPLGA